VVGTDNLADPSDAPELRFGFRGAERQLARRVTSFSSALFGIQVASVVKLQSDEFVIGASLPVAYVTRTRSPAG
jgi:O-antigen/teichoic acid export membrane protein